MEELVAKRVAEELERRKDEIESEVLRRVEEAKKVGEYVTHRPLENKIPTLCAYVYIYM